MTIWRKRIACVITKAINTRLEYVILIAFHCNNGCSNAPQCTYVILTMSVLFYSDPFYLLTVGAEVIVTPDQTQWHTIGRSSLGKGSASGKRPLLTQHTTIDTNIYTAGRIRTRNPNKRAVSDLRLRPHGNRDRHCAQCLLLSVLLYQTCGNAVIQ